MKPAVILDRDGVICEYVDELHRPDQIVLRKGIGTGIRALNQNGYLIFVATNQPMVAKGIITLNDLDQIHQRMKSLLLQEGAFLDDIFFCPHKVPGIIAEFSTSCQCRKPLSGMLKQAYEKYNFDKSKSWMIGDTWRDVGCAHHFGIPCLAVEGGAGFPYPEDSKENLYQPDQLFNSPSQAIQWILSQNENPLK